MEQFLFCFALKFTFVHYQFYFFLHMRTGKVKFFIESKGYGFITDEETGRDIFVHATGVKSENLREGDRVSYEEEEGRKGKVAAQVTAIDN